MELKLTPALLHSFEVHTFEVLTRLVSNTVNLTTPICRKNWPETLITMRDFLIFIFASNISFFVCVCVGNYCFWWLNYLVVMFYIYVKEILSKWDIQIKLSVTTKLEKIFFLQIQSLCLWKMGTIFWGLNATHIHKMYCHVKCTILDEMLRTEWVIWWRLYKNLWCVIY